jgi:hypothetical protein
MYPVADIAEGNPLKTLLRRYQEKRFRRRYIDNGWPATEPHGHAVSELATDRTGALSPFGDVEFPVTSADLPYVHPVTVVNR